MQKLILRLTLFVGAVLTIAFLAGQWLWRFLFGRYKADTWAWEGGFVEPPFAEVWARIVRNPVIIGVLVISILDAWTTGISIRQGIILTIGVIVRFFTTPAAEVEAHKTASYQAGYDLGVADGSRSVLP